METNPGGRNLGILRRELIEKFREENLALGSSREGRLVISEFIKCKFNLKNPSSLLETEIDRAIHSFLVVFKNKWDQCNRTYSRFAVKHQHWMDGYIYIANVDLPSGSSACCATTQARGRPAISFLKSGPKTKRKKIRNLLEHRSLEELCFATEQKLRQAGRRDAADVLKTLLSSRKKATDIKKLYKSKINEKPPVMYTPDEALSLLVSLKLTKNQYCLLRQGALDKGINLYPSYKKIVKAKNSCYPNLSDMEVTDILAEAKLQTMVELTINRLILSRNYEIAHSVIENDLSDLVMSFKWGCDGCGSHSRYKQLSNKGIIEDSNILVSSFVPLLLKAKDAANQEYILWQNPCTSSTRYCRPIRFRFVKETHEELVREMTNVKEEISNLNNVIVELCDHTFTIKSEFFETMVDGKVCNALSSNRNTQKCYICGATSRDMNDLDEVSSRDCNQQTFSWGLSTLHGYIRCMECLLHISYKLDIKKWQARSDEEKQNVSKRKKHIIDEFRLKTGLLIDIPSQGGGNTNDGNTARRFFQMAEVTSEITGIDKELIENFDVILRVLSSGEKINLHKFERFTIDTAKRYVELYKWYPMSVTVHKLLIYGPTIVNHFLLPIGKMAEDVQEARHKEIKRFRENFSRKMSRSATNRDIINNLLISSDPLISSIRPIHATRHHEFSEKISQLLILQNDTADVEESESDNDLSLSDMSL